MTRAIVLVRGIFSSSKTWESLMSRMTGDEDLADLSLVPFDYYSPRFRISPTRAIPDYDDVALKLWTSLKLVFAEHDSVIIIAHSQGGLIVQRMLAQQVGMGAAESLTPIHAIVLLACPNSGSELFLTLRRYVFLWRHPQEQALRPLDKAIERTRSVVLQKVVYASEVTPATCPIPIYAYAGESDGRSEVSIGFGPIHSYRRNGRRSLGHPTFRPHQ